MNIKVQELVRNKILKFRDVGSNVKNNLLPVHGAVNSIEDVSYVCVIQNVEDIKTPLLSFHARLVVNGLINACHDNCEECAIHPRGCKIVQADIQDLMDQGVLQVSGLAKNEEVSVIVPSFNFQEHVEITYKRRDVV